MVYILEFDRSLSHAKFYVGYCVDCRLFDRLREHRSGRGAAILRACNEQGITYRLFATLPDASRDDERRIKRHKCTPRLVDRIRLGRVEGWHLWQT